MLHFDSTGTTYICILLCEAYVLLIKYVGPDRLAAFLASLSSKSVHTELKIANKLLKKGDVGTTDTKLHVHC